MTSPTSSPSPSPTRRVRPVSEYATSIVLLSPGHTRSVICFSEPVPYAETQLDPPLIAGLRTWGASYSAGLAPDYSWRSPTAEARFWATGARLAQRLADQIGDAFQVQYDVGRTQRRVRGAHPARNPDAAAAFTRMADDARADWARLREVAARAWRDSDTKQEINEPFGPASRPRRA